MTDEFRTVAEEFRYETERVKGSRFLATVFPARSAEEAEAAVARISLEFADASHNCWAWRLGKRGELFRFSDDGEPGGSAGRPILAQIEGHDVTDLGVVVTRWFGGTKLGVGGLMRAYGGAAGQALDRAPIRTVVVTRAVMLSFPYECSGVLEGLLGELGLEPRAAVYEADVRFDLDVPERTLEAFRAEVAERTAGRAAVTDRPSA